MASKEITSTESAVEVDGAVAAKNLDRSDADSTHTQSSLPVAEKPTQTWRSYFWDTFDKSPEGTYSQSNALFELILTVL